jgi:hypothetical protein
MTGRAGASVAAGAPSHHQKTGEVREEVVAGVTSLGPERADAAQLLALVRGQWQIEKLSHWGREVTFDEDCSQVWCGSIPQGWRCCATQSLG